MHGKPIVTGVSSDQIILDYRPREFPTLVTPSATDFTSQQVTNESSGFKINPLIAEKAGISKLQAESLERAIEAQALEKLKEVQERAYQEAFDLGLLEGTEKAFEEHKEEFAARLAYLDSILKSFEDLKGRLVSENEAQMMSLIFEIAKRIALVEINANPNSILEVIRKVVEGAQTDERLVIRVSKEDFEFIESLKQKQGATQDQGSKDQEMLRKIRLEIDPKVKSGGCLLETNYGSIDASIQQRVNKAWEIISTRSPKIQESDLGLPESEAAHAQDGSLDTSVDGSADRSENSDDDDDGSQGDKS